MATENPLSVRDIGSFHLGGRMVTLSGLPVRQRVSTEGGPAHPVDPNGEVIVGQLYVQYTRLASPVAHFLCCYGTAAG